MMDKSKGSPKAGSKGLALLLAVGRKKAGGSRPPESDSDDSVDKPSFGESLKGGAMDDASETPSKADVALDDVAEALNVPEEARGDFSTALKNAIKACMSESDESEGEMPDESPESASRF